MPLVGIVLTALLMLQVLVLLAFAWALAGIGLLVGLLKYEPEPQKENPIWGPYDSYLAAVERGRKDFPLSL